MKLLRPKETNGSKSGILSRNFYVSNYVCSINFNHIVFFFKIHKRVKKVSFSDCKNVVKTLGNTRVSVQGVESLWGDCRFIPADWGS